MSFREGRRLRDGGAGEVRPAGERPCTGEDDVLKVDESVGTVEETRAPPPRNGVLNRVKSKAERLRKKWFGK